MNAMNECGNGHMFLIYFDGSLLGPRCPICERDAEIARLKDLLVKARVKALLDVKTAEAVRDRFAAKNKELAEMLMRYVRGVPLGHQPHMAAAKAEELARAALGEDNP